MSEAYFITVLFFFYIETKRVVRCAQIRFFTNTPTMPRRGGRLFVFLSILYFAVDLIRHSRSSVD